MYSALHYNQENVPAITIMNDIAAVLTGKTDLTEIDGTTGDPVFSSFIQPEDSYINTTVSTSNFIEVGRIKRKTVGVTDEDKSIFLKQVLSDTAGTPQERFRYLELFTPLRLSDPSDPSLHIDPAEEGTPWTIWTTLATHSKSDSIRNDNSEVDEFSNNKWTSMEHAVLMRWHQTIDESAVAAGNYVVNPGAFTNPLSETAAFNEGQGEMYPPRLDTNTKSGLSITGGVHLGPYSSEAGYINRRLLDPGNAASTASIATSSKIDTAMHRIPFACRQAQGETMLLITASDKHLGFQSFFNNLSESSTSPFMFEHTRLSPWDTVDNDFDNYVITATPICEQLLHNGDSSSTSIESSNFGSDDKYIDKQMPFFKWKSMPNLGGNPTDNSEVYDYLKIVETARAGAIAATPVVDNVEQNYGNEFAHHHNLLQLATLGGVSPQYASNPNKIEKPGAIVPALGLDVNMHLDADMLFQPILIPFGCHNIGLGHFGGDISSGSGCYLMTSGVGQTHHALTVNGQDYRIWTFGQYRMAIIDG